MFDHGYYIWGLENTTFELTYSCDVKDMPDMDMVCDEVMSSSDLLKDVTEDVMEVLLMPFCLAEKQTNKLLIYNASKTNFIWILQLSS